MTAKHPVFGVGPGQFAIQRWDQKKAEGYRGTGYFVTHNSYTQMSSETGLPGLIILLTLLGGCYRAIGSVLRMAKTPGCRVPEYVVNAGVYLRLSLTTVVVCAFFLSVAYTQLFYILAAITAVYYHAAQAEAAQWQDSPSHAPIAAPAVVAAPVLLPAFRRYRSGFRR